ncbi:MAG TPA: serine hydrolase domain-containing protein [Candidatus Sulfotelmatobacter sp.]|nr:serine hydrolase domain-containing protein [Candidatus Sulfotelmatobacter sp.]
MRPFPIRNDAPILAPAIDSQENQFSSAFAFIRKAIADRVFPAASIAVTQSGKLLALKSFGTFVYEEDVQGAPSLSHSSDSACPDRSRRHEDFDFPNEQVIPATLFDLASLTKSIATTTMAMMLYERGLLELDAPVIGTVPEFLLDSSGNSDPRRHDVTFRMLLAHSAGLPAYEKLFLKAQSREDLLTAAMTMPLKAGPGTRAEYSDIGFIILGVALERLAQESLAVFCQREVFGPLAMMNTTFNPSPELRQKIPPTADERKAVCGAGAPAREMSKAELVQSVSHSETRGTFRHRIIQGEVQDENAWVLGGTAGHAGLFSTAEDVARFANALLRGGSPILRPETIALFTQPDTTPHTSRALGWDTPSNPSQSGKYFGPRSYGHLGYTGTSLWIDPDRELSVTLLTNRTWPDCANQAIRRFRPEFHDLVIECL